MDFEKIESKFKPSTDGKAAYGKNGMVSTAFPNATATGLEMLKLGGNAVDAACAAALALAVCEPQASGIGGQTMMLIYTGKKVVAIDGSSRAPSLAHKNAIYKRDRASGYRATTIPSTLATLSYVQKKYGELNWRRVVEPAVQIAKHGYEITPLQNRLQIREEENFNSIESKSGKKTFYKDGSPFPVGEVFRQPELAYLLKTIADKGVDEFYSGSIAKRIDADMRDHGGLLRYDDLALIPYPIERQPLRRKFRGLTVYTMPPPGAGRTLLFSLNMVNAIHPRRLSKDKTRQAQLLVEIFRKALLERSDRPYDPNYFSQVTEKDMLKSEYARTCIKEIISSVAPGLPIRITMDEFSGETTHLSIMDKEGMTVSLTQSIERVYGSKVVSEGLGFLYNNYLMDFDYDQPSHPYYLRPNAVPWATVAPSLVFNENDIWMAMGSPGSERIMSAITQFLIHIIDEEMSIDEAMRAPRLHCSLGGRISLEAERFSKEIIDVLADKGYRIDKRDSYSFYLGAIQAVMKCQYGSGFQGIAEIRRDGTAAG